jgi:hypothetical protein
VLTFIQFAAAFFLGEAQKRRLGYMAKLEALNLQLAEEQELRSRWAVAAERSGSPASCTTSSPTR